MSDPRPPWDIPSRWKPALEAARAGGTFLLIGAIDSGKSTLAAVLANEARAAGRAVAVIDADVGQSSIGPPTCVGMARVEGEIGSLEDLRPGAIDFVGAPSPMGHLLQCATSTSAMAAAARTTAADTLIVDTTGLISGSFARALKVGKVRLLDPDFVIALQFEDEVEHLVAAYRSRARPKVLRLPVSRAVKERSRDERAARRQRKFAAYFAQGTAAEISWDRAPVENSQWTSGEPAPGHISAYAEECLGCEVLYAERQGDGILVIVKGRVDAADLRTLGEGFGGRARALDAAALDHLLVGLLGERGKTLGLGIIEAIDFLRRRLSVFTPLADPEQARGIRLGALLIGRDGTQLGYNDPGAVG
jgi:polynucleotide 5'-hydroxyl-kinase GRC3/NOL9